MNKPTADLISVRIEAFLVSPHEDFPFLRDAVAATRVLPAHVDLVGFAGIRHDLTVWSVSDGDGNPMTPVTDETTRNAVLYDVSQRYPALATLCPRRPADAVTCPICSGTGIWTEGAMACECGGLGWPPASNHYAIRGPNE